MSFESPELQKPIAPQEQQKARERQFLPFPHAEGGLKKYLKEYKHPERTRLLREVFNEFLEEELQNTKIFRSQESGAELPFTSISIARLARRIHERILGKPIPSKAEDLPPSKQTFVFGTGIFLEDGSQFEVIEFAMHECVKKLPAALEQLQKGDQVEEEEIFTIGMPTNVFGRIPPELVEAISENPSDELAKTYSEFIASRIGKGESAPKSVELLGMSMGANFAIRSGESLLDKALVTQNHKTAKERNLPYLQIRADVPISLGPSRIKPIQIPVGFVADALMATYRSDVRRISFGAGGREFKEVLRQRLAERGIEWQMSEEQKRTKQKVMQSIITALGRGLRPRAGTKVTELYGLKDVTSVTPGMILEAKKQKKEYAKTLGKNLLPRKEAKKRRFGINMMHLSPWFRKNELRRMDKLAETLESLKR